MGVRSLVIIGGALLLGAGVSAEERFRVSDEAITLREVSILLYGDATHWREIAKNNHLPPPYRIRTGQELLLPIPPTLSLTEGRAKLLSYWRRHFGLPTEALPLPEPDARSEFKLGLELFQKKSYSEAIEHFENSRRLNPDLLPTWFFLINANRKLKRLNVADRLASELKEKHPELANLPLLKDESK